MRILAMHTFSSGVRGRQETSITSSLSGSVSAVQRAGEERGAGSHCASGGGRRSSKDPGS